MKTLKITKALIALNYDTSAQKVAESGFSLAKTLGAEVTLLHVLTDPMTYTSKKHIRVMGFAGQKYIGPLQSEDIDGLKEVARLFLDKVSLHLGDKTIHSLVTEGNLADSILSTAKKMHADVIIMGSHGRKACDNETTANVTERVLYRTSIPLLIIPVK